MSKEKISSKIWKEISEKNNPFAASTCFCSGYDVYGELLRKASWIEYLYLLFVGERPNDVQKTLLEAVALALANPGPRDHSVRAAMNGSVSGSANAASLIAALAIGAGEFGGGRDIVEAMQLWKNCGTNVDLWQKQLNLPVEQQGASIWPPFEHPPGFDPHGVSCAGPVLQTLDYLTEIYSTGMLAWLKENRLAVESLAECPLAMSGVVAAAFIDLDLSVDQSEMLYLLLRLPGAAVHALEQKAGWRQYPFFMDSLEIVSESVKK